MILARHHRHSRDRLLTSKITGLLHIWDLGLWHALRVLVLWLRHSLRGWVLRLGVCRRLLHPRTCRWVILRSAWWGIRRRPTTEMPATRRILRGVHRLLLVQSIEVYHIWLWCVNRHGAIRSNSRAFRWLQTFPETISVKGLS